MRRWAALLALLVLPALLGVDRPRGLGDITDVRHWSYEGYTRVVVELTRPVRPEVHRLKASPGGRERLYLDLADVWVGRRYDTPIPVGDGLLHAIRLGQNTLQRTRVVIDLDGYDRHRLLLLSSPPRVVVDVYGEPARPEARDSAEGPRLPLHMRPVRTVVLDPGHGGRDPGAIGFSGVREKDLVLDLARQLRPRLEQAGFRVVMTREQDEARSLEERTAIAEGARGDLFVSLHANAARRRGASGIETYYLDETHERHTLRLAALENGTSPPQLDELQRTLATLRVSEVSERSAELARHVHGELIRGLRSSYDHVEDLGVKRGPFYVLFLSSMPAILVETGFLTNRREAKRLRSSQYVELLVERITAGIVQYRDQRALRLAGAGR